MRGLLRTAISFLGDLLQGRLHTRLTELEDSMKSTREIYQERFEKLNGAVNDVVGALTTEAEEVRGVKDELANLRSQLEGQAIDTSGLDALTERLGGIATRISGLVEPLQSAPAESGSVTETGGGDAPAETPAAIPAEQGSTDELVQPSPDESQLE